MLEKVLIRSLFWKTDSGYGTTFRILGGLRSLDAVGKFDGLILAIELRILGTGFISHFRVNRLVVYHV